MSEHYKGYAGRVLKINVTDKTYEDFPWTDDDRKRTLGGKIMAADILFNHITPEMKAFDEDNWLVVTTGPLTGCGCPNSSRFNISTISPLTNIVTSSNCGGDFGLNLKRAGFDALIITGRAESLTHIAITEDGVTFNDVSDMKGMLVSEAQEKFPKRDGKIVIGPAGENKVLYAGIFSNERTAGRGGTGAVMGDKNIKAITVHGIKVPQVYDREKLKKVNKKWAQRLLNHPLTGRQLPKLGSAGLVAPMQAHHILATKNFGTGQFDGFEKVSGEALAENHLVSNAACTSCVIRCARVVNVDGKNVKGPELETLGLLGPNIMNDNIEAILKWNYELDEYGMDTISAAGTIAFAMELNEKGMWDNGLEFGKIDNISQIFHNIAFREGIGDILADGTKRISDRFGGKDFSINAKGMELSAYEPRGAVGQGLGYATANRGGCHLNAGYMVVVEGLGLDVNPLTPHGKAALSITFQNLMETISAAGCCLFTSYSVFPNFLVDKPNSVSTKAILGCFPYVGPVVNVLNRFPGIAQINLPLLPYSPAIAAATGMKSTIATMLKWGIYGYTLERTCNVILGQKKGADILPKRLTDEEQIKGNPKTKVPLEKLKKDYYSARGWKDGVPSLHAIKKAGIKLPEKYKSLFM